MALLERATDEFAIVPQILSKCVSSDPNTSSFTLSKGHRLAAGMFQENFDHNLRRV